MCGCNLAMIMGSYWEIRDGCPKRHNNKGGHSYIKGSSYKSTGRCPPELTKLKPSRYRCSLQLSRDILILCSLRASHSFKDLGLSLTLSSLSITSFLPSNSSLTCCSNHWQLPSLLLQASLKVISLRSLK